MPGWVSDGWGLGRLSKAKAESPAAIFGSPVTKYFTSAGRDAETWEITSLASSLRVLVFPSAVDCESS